MEAKLLTAAASSTVVAPCISKPSPRFAYKSWERNCTLPFQSPRNLRIGARASASAAPTLRLEDTRVLMSILSSLISYLLPPLEYPQWYTSVPAMSWESPNPPENEVEPPENEGDKGPGSSVANPSLEGGLASPNPSPIAEVEVELHSDNDRSKSNPNSSKGDR
ncbi:hypothetical protein SASPL_131129 [Salvia splendens]|uniref:Uncharacterized protein n=1 Tax=Salvia splendens TaxID=180675 RepID=A0A8X8X6X6_SALSN|nr:hypothetical protein SASPL_131129 [Salvia splendens]